MGAILTLKALILTTSRIANWLVVYGQLPLEGDGVTWMPLLGILFSHLLCFFFMRTEKTRRSKCPSLLISLVQVGAILELSPFPLCPRCSKKTSRAPISVELAQRSEVGSFVSSFNLPPSSTTSDVPDPSTLPSDSEDLDKLRTRVLKKICVAQVPESVCCTVFALDRLISEVHGINGFWPPVPALWSVGMSGTLATLLVAWGFADIIVSMWIKTDFVQDNAAMVQFFYLVEICSWWPFLFQIAQAATIQLMVEYLFSELAVMICLVVVGFYVIPGSSKFRRSLMNIVLHFFGQVALAATLSPFLAGANLLFFDSSLTFRFLNLLYYPVRYLHIAWYINHLPQSVHELALDPVNGFALGFLLIQLLLVYIVVPYLRRASLKQTAEEFQQHTGGTLEVSVTKTGDPQVKLRSNTGLRTTIFSDLTSPEDSFIDVLNAVGDTFEALLLASQADSPRVRCAVLGVAIQPLSEAGPAKLLHLLPLILPQLLLALRWRTAEDFEDCPLSRFIIEKALSLHDTNLVSMVYWQLLGLASDRADKACHMYQEMRNRLLNAFLQSDFNGRQYDGDFCEKALGLIANQRRLCYQVRVISRAVASASGGHAGRTAALRQQLNYLQERRRDRTARQVVADEGEQPMDVETAPERIEKDQSSQEDVLEEPRRKQVLFAECERRSNPRRDRAFGSGEVQRQISDFPTEGARCPLCPCLLRKGQKTKVDVIREEWRADPSMQAYGNQDLSLLDASGTPLPVDARPLSTLNPTRCFVANSAVAPVVFAYEALDSEGVASSLYAVKKGDDLRQDAFVLQIFRIMETIWAEHGLREISLLPYNALALSPKEGMAAFVPKAKNIATILQEFNGDIGQFIKKHCSNSISAAYDELCGSTAGYCIATYLLGIGDRHLDNIMITEDGHFFHIDFGFVLGDDPKPGAPSVRVPREVLDLLRHSGRYDRFRELLREAFTLVRRTARLWTALLSLASSAGGNGVTPLRDDADRAIHTVRQRLHLELDDAAAAAEVTAEVEQNATAMLPVIFDKLHQAGLFWH